MIFSSHHFTWTFTESLASASITSELAKPLLHQGLVVRALGHIAAVYQEVSPPSFMAAPICVSSALY